MLLLASESYQMERLVMHSDTMQVYERGEKSPRVLLGSGERAWGPDKERLREREV